jgi:DNA polymerase I-like protein with 3'-5' exonuclease and polymerase domains
LIQGSAADCTKEAIIRYHDMPGKVGRFMLQVHDEIDISCPKKAFKAEMLRLREAMMSVEFDVPMLSDAEYGPNWADLQDLEEPPYQFKD